MSRMRNVFTGEEIQEPLPAALRDLVERSSSPLWCSPGWIDIQVNGFAGVDFNRPGLTPGDLERAVARLHRVGVAHFLPTVITNDEATMTSCLRSLDAACDASPRVAQAVTGVHLEGPFISPREGARGAHSEHAICAPTVAHFERLQRASGHRVKLVTLAPEWPEAPEFIRTVAAQGVRIALGHTLADAEQIAAAVEAGATLSTHLGNGVPAQLPRHPNVIWHQLAEDRLFASAIFDGFHLPDSVIKVLYRQKGAKLLLTSDAVALAEMPAGVYKGQVGGSVELHPSGKLTILGSDYLAGSASSLLDGVNTALRTLHLSLPEAIRMVTRTPQQVLGLADSESFTVFALEAGKIRVRAVSGEKKS